MVNPIQLKSAPNEPSHPAGCIRLFRGFTSVPGLPHLDTSQLTISRLMPPPLQI